MTGGTGLLFTTNTGTTWTATTGALPGTANIVGINGFGTNWVVVRTAQQIYYSTNDGTTWATQYTSPAGNYTHVTKSRSTGSTYWAVRDNGGISKGALLTGIQPIAENIPLGFRLAQNYPNPFNPSTNIKFSLPKGSFTTLIVYDELGRQVNELVSEDLKAGTYEVNFDASELPSGTYFYKLTSGNFIETKRMILIK